MNHTAKLIHSTPDGDNLIAYIARVSSLNQDRPETAPKLIKFLINNRHWSPFEMASACFEINTTRDIGRQILRHRSFSFQEFSGRYAAYDSLDKDRECRLQDTKNRQNSIEVEDAILKTLFNNSVREVADLSWEKYNEALEMGIAKEQARALLPEGLVPTKMYMHGNIRSWIHYCNERTYEGTQKEHRIIAEQIKGKLAEIYPLVFSAAYE